jgi:hypothetical protein
MGVLLVHKATTYPVTVGVTRFFITLSLIRGFQRCLHVHNLVSFSYVGWKFKCRSRHAVGALRVTGYLSTKEIVL